MKNPLKILIVEDNLFDVELIQLELRKTNKEFESRVVHDEKKFLNELKTFQPDLILSGYAMPQFTGLNALDIAKKKYPKIPFIIVTGTLNEETAVKCMRWGAWDYVLKDRLIHLGLAVQNALRLKAENDKKKLAEKALRESEKKYRSLIEQSLQGLIIIQDFRIVFANSAFAEISGYSVEDLLSHSPEKIRTMIHPEDQSLVWKRFRDRLEGKTVQSRYEYRGIRKNGKVRWLEMFANRIEYYGKPAIQGAVIDITKRKQAEEALRSAKLEKEIILNSLTDHVIYEDKEMKILWANKSACKSVDLTREELVGRYCYEIWPQRSDPCPDCPVIKAMKTKKPQEIKKSTPDGRIWFIRGYPIRDEKGDIVGGIEVTSDITERKKAEKALQESEEKYRNIFEEFQDLYYKTDLNGILWDISPSVTKLAGYKREELIGKSVSKIYKNPPDRINFLKALKKTGNVEDYELTLLGKDGREIIASATSHILFDKNNKPIGIEGVLRDITERKQVEKALQESESKFRTLFEEAPAAVAVVDNSGVVVSCNESTEKLTGYNRKEIIGKPFEKLMTLNPEDLSILVEYFEKLVVGIEVEPYLLQIIRKDGKRRWIRIQNSLLRKGEEVIGIQVYAVDITNRVQAEKIQKTLFNISNAVNTVGNLHELFIKIRDYLGNIIDTTNFYIALYDEKTETISLPFEVDEKDEFETFPAGKTMTKHVIKTGKPLLATKDVERKLIKKGLIETVGAPSKIWLGVPLKVENKVIGVIVVQSYDDPNLYTEKDIEMLTFVSEEIALAINRKQAEEQIKKDLEEKEILLQEIHHRVKNNMQIISSLLKLQSAHITDKKALELFQNSRDRVKTMALIHDSLYRSKDMGNINFADYIRKLTTQIFVSYGANSNFIKLKTNIKDIFLDISTAIPCGLIINELISNSLKYAFPEGRKGEINISFTYKNQVYILCIQDNGIGISGKIDLENSSTLGLLLVNSLTKQLNGTLELEKVKGTSFKITFKKTELKTYGRVQS